MEDDIFNLVEEKNTLLSIIDDLKEQIQKLTAGKSHENNDLIITEIENNENDTTSIKSQLQDYTNRYLSQDKILNQERVNKTILTQELIQKNTLIERTKETEIRIREEKTY